MIDNLSIRFNKDEAKIPRVPWLIDELKDYGYERLPSGRYRYGAPSGKHDDGVCALMLAYWDLPPMMSAVSTQHHTITDFYKPNKFTGYIVAGLLIGTQLWL